MLMEFILGFLFILAWAGFFILIGRQKSIVKASLGVFLLFTAMGVMNYLKWHLGEPRGWFLGFITGFPIGLWLVQRIGPEKPSEESAIALFLLGPLIFAITLMIILFI
ncbi:hypothetical protein K1720_07480 [Thermococcus argininiproducens]|uniref:Uncharacterized protein n=1 Tax=Thermococcus argininiproducens TaxID=2866384 RepID=A0A9E7M8K1_9EURY|nr:hypothetical protein [Thermococcus argininiproducens]USG99370.1 hypothetical protein K1720_07480 [Thermococcus argininiproducens]